MPGQGLNALERLMEPLSGSRDRSPDYEENHPRNLEIVPSDREKALNGI